MEAGDYQPHGTVWGSLITACGKAGQLGLAEGLWEELAASGEDLTVEHFHSLMNACVWTCQARLSVGQSVGQSFSQSVRQSNSQSVNYVNTSGLG